MYLKIKTYISINQLQSHIQDINVQVWGFEG